MFDGRPPRTNTTSVSSPLSVDQELSSSPPFPLYYYTDSRIAIVLLCGLMYQEQLLYTTHILSSTVGVTPPSRQAIAVCLHRRQRVVVALCHGAGGADNQPVLDVCTYVLCRRMRDRAENPAVGVGVVHQALATSHTTQGGFFVSPSA